MVEPAATPARVEVIDALRGVGAVAVILFHFVGFIPLLDIPVGRVGAVVVAVTRPGHLRVPVFFVLSGFVIAMTASRYRFTPATGGRFLLRRLVRITPPYWAMIGVITAAVVGGHAAGYFRNTTVTPAQVVAHLAFAQEVLAVPPLDVAYWTLCLEVQFYLVFTASAVLLGSQRPAVRALWFAALTVASLVLDAADVVPQAWVPRLWYQFGMGVLAHAAGQDRAARLALFGLTPVVLAAGLIRGTPDHLAVPAVALLLLLRDRPWVAAPARLPPLRWLGRISYSLYLVHGLIGMGLGVWFRAAPARSEGASWAAVGVATATALAVAWVFNRVFERPAVEWSRRVPLAPRPPAE